MRRFILSILFVGLFGLVVSASYIYAQDEEPTTDYIGSRLCFGCHRDVAPAHFESRHALALQDTSDDSEPILADFEQGEDIRTIQLPGEEGARAFTAEDIAYAIGTGRYVQRYVAQVELDGAETYMVLPAEWNAVEQIWQPYTPAEEWPSEAYDFVQNCAGCHVTGLNAAEEEPWLEAGVQCESCHGPGADHFAIVREVGGSPEPEELDQIRAAIVLSPDSQICGQCHSQGTTPDGLPYPVDYLPGQNLLDEGVFALYSPEDSAHWWPTGHASQKYMQFNEDFYFGHSGSLDSLRESEGAEDACLVCHSEDSRWTADLLAAHESGEREGTPPDAVTVESAQFGVTCVSCHTIHIAAGEDAEAAPVHDFLIEQATYDLCVACHQDTDITESMHHPVQEMYEGQTVIEEVTGVPSAHFVAEDGPECATCHMPRVPTDMLSRASHTFQPVMPGSTLDLEGLQDTCSACHSDQVNAAGLQALIDDVQADTRARLDTARGALADDSPDWVKIGLDFVEGDGSLGVHNYVYTDDVLDAIEAELGLTAQEGNIADDTP
jgi:hypothetical protein